MRRGARRNRFRRAEVDWVARRFRYLRESFAAIKKSVGAIDAKNMFDPIEGPYAGPNTRLGLAGVIVWHNADHYGQMALYLRLNGIVPPSSRPEPPPLRANY